MRKEVESSMPELPEVQTVISTLGPRIMGKSIARVWVGRSDIIHPAETDFPGLVSGRIVRGLSRRGKRIVFELDDGARFFIHLGMTGRLTLERPVSGMVPH